MDADEREKERPAKDAQVPAAAPQGEAAPAIEAQMAPPLPPAPPGQPLNVAVGMQLVQGSTLDRLPPGVQQQILEHIENNDKRGFEFACEDLRGENEFRNSELKDRGQARRDAIRLFGWIAGPTLAFGFLLVIVLILKDKYELAEKVMIAGTTLVSGLLGGAGLVGIVKRFGFGSGSDSGHGAS